MDNQSRWQRDITCRHRENKHVQFSPAPLFHSFLHLRSRDGTQCCTHRLPWLTIVCHQSQITIPVSLSQSRCTPGFCVQTPSSLISSCFHLVESSPNMTPQHFLSIQNPWVTRMAYTFKLLWILFLLLLSLMFCGLTYSITSLPLFAKCLYIYQMYIGTEASISTWNNNSYDQQKKNSNCFYGELISTLLWCLLLLMQ